jgi:hypothetical protein
LRSAAEEGEPVRTINPINPINPINNEAAMKGDNFFIDNQYVKKPEITACPFALGFLVFRRRQAVMKSTKNFTQLHIVSVRLESQEKRTRKMKGFSFFPGRVCQRRETEERRKRD